MTSQVIEFKDKRPKDRGGDIGGDLPIRRSISFQPIYAWLYNNVISLDFEDLLPTITISIINETTGVTIYLENYNNLNSIIIDLSTEKSGYYLIRIEYDDIILEGNFVLE
ncbi:DUF3244 domain-containing protein [Bacteroides cellulosilyticus]|uniref:DUF3244 domain-containing protein n=1 Tax=Bacteroides cellulosilyticus TaxID=246787 RepID=UPI00189DF78D